MAPFLLLTAALAALLAWWALRFARMENRMGAFIGMAVTLTLMLQFALFYLSSFTSWSEEFYISLLIHGNTALLIDVVLVWLLLSALRGEVVPELVAQMRSTCNDATSSQSAARA